MQVDPDRLVVLAEQCEQTSDRLRADWEVARTDLLAACHGIGNASGSELLVERYTDVASRADELVDGLTRALGVGVASLVEAARDASKADDRAADELGRPGRRVGHDHPAGGRRG